MRYLIVDFEDKTITWKDTLDDINEGGSTLYGSRSMFWRDLRKEIKLKEGGKI